MTQHNHTQPPIAIIGMGCMFAKSSALKDFWRLIFRGEDGIDRVPETHWSVADYFDKDPKRPDHVYCRRGGFLSPVSFDPSDFGIPPANLEATDTSQLLGLLTARAALKDAGYLDGKHFDRDRTSVILGATGTQELAIPLGARLGHPHWRRALASADLPEDKIEQIVRDISSAYVPWQENSFPGLLGNVVAGRICNRLDLGGTNCVVDAACASSMSALHLALMELAADRSDMVITGGVDLLNDIFMHMCFSSTYILSPTEEIRPFSKDADGTLLGEGLGMLVLKRLPDAERDGDRIYALIRGIGASSDGKSQSIYAPRTEGQVKALHRAYAQADVSPDTVEMIEAHGTGTRVGDQVEFQTLNTVFGNSGNKGRRCALGSVKSQIGHAKAAAGSAGLIKTALALYHKVLPPTLKAESTDPRLGIDDSPFYLNPASRPWVSLNDHPRRAGVSSFGFGGSNFHTVLEEYEPKKRDVSWDGTVEILALCAPDFDSLRAQLVELQNEAASGWTPADLAVSAFESRNRFSADAPYRLLLAIEAQPFHAGIIPEMLNTAADALLANGRDRDWQLPHMCYGSGPATGKLAVLFPGQGSQYPGMGKDLVCLFPEALAVMTSADSHFQQANPNATRLSDIIFPLDMKTRDEAHFSEARLRSTDNAQPAIGAVSLAMWRVLQRFNIRPDVAGGHSFGELTALCAAGWCRETDLHALSIHRGRCMAAASNGEDRDAGTMMAVMGPLTELAEKLAESRIDVVLANRNSPEQGVLSGPAAAITLAETKCRDWGFKTRRLPVSAAFHSPLMDAACAPFEAALSGVHFTPTPIRVYANTDGKPYPEDPAAARRQLRDQLVKPVEFIENIQNMTKDGVRTFLEVGPKSVLTGLCQSILKDAQVNLIALDSSSGRRNGVMDLAVLLCRLAALGRPVALDQWEETAVRPAKPKLSVMLTGANHRSSTPEKPKPLTPEKPALPPPTLTVREPVREMVSDTIPGKPNDARLLTNPSRPEGQHPMNSSPKGSPPAAYIETALRVAEQGLKSMQALQMKTAEAHQKFLDTQAEAARVLMEMMTSARQMTGSIEGRNNGDYRPPRADAVPKPEAVESLRLSIPKPAPSSAPPAPPVAQPAEAAPAVGAVLSPPVENTIHSEVSARLLAVVSKLTGYPEEMLDPEMDIESDLGIDSIKRVEILSTLEESLPGLPPVQPEVMGKLKTLGQIVDHLTGARETAGKVTAQPYPAIENEAAPHSATAATADLEDELLSVVSRLTGYPRDMLGLEMDIEADLGIDSIKRVEILSSLEETIPGLPRVQPDVMGKLKTLQQIVHFLSAPVQNPDQPPVQKGEKPLTAGTKTGAPTPLTSDAVSDETTTSMARSCVRLEMHPYQDVSSVPIDPNATVYITADASGRSDALATAFSALGQPARCLGTGAVQEILRTDVFPPDACGLVLIPDAASISDNGLGDRDIEALSSWFLLSQRAAPVLLSAAKSRSALFAAITSLDGAFGFSGKGLIRPAQGALAGLVKTAAIEWDTITCRAIDVSSDWKDEQALADHLAAELMTVVSGRPDVETGLTPSGRISLYLSPVPLGSEKKGGLPVDRSDVFVVTGGARGVTAVSVLALARAAAPVLILLGRSEAPFAEPEWLLGLTDAPGIKKAIIANEFSGPPPSPRAVEAAYLRYTANREISQNLRMINATGAQVAYFQADVRNEAELADVLTNVRALHGPITGILHGAGVLEDRLIVDKTPEQITRVFETKILGAQHLLACTATDPLKYIVFFSSVAARFGNRGQADYAMANEMLNKMAEMEAVRRPSCRALAINWGPWDGGMVTEGVKREFIKRGIDLIPMAAGAQCFLNELMQPGTAPAQIVLGADLTEKKSSTAGMGGKEEVSPPLRPAASDLLLLFKREIDVRRLPVLDSHRLDGVPVVPFALIAEWIGHGAMHGNPGLYLHGLDDMRLLKGIRLETDAKTIRLMAGKARKNGETYEVDVEIRNGVKDGKDVIHSRAKAVLSQKIHEAPVIPPDFISRFAPYETSVREVYEKILFHGVHLQGLKHIIGMSEKGMAAEIAAAPAPEKWMTDPMRSRWISDPLALDCAFQMACLWCYEQLGAVSLPSYSAAYRQFCREFPKNGVTAVLDVTDRSRHKMVGNFTFVDSNHVVVATLSGYEAIADASLYRSFKPDN